MNKEFFIPYKTPSSKNNKEWVNGKLISSAATMLWRDLTEVFWQEYREDFLTELSTVRKPYNIKFTFIRGTKHKFDYINPAQTVLDEMVRHKWIEDDNVDIIKPYFGDYQYDKDNPGVLIEVLDND